ncbi:MAG: septal ring lytic transglycosylase RlpA family protein [Nitrospiria bacterium]
MLKSAIQTVSIVALAALFAACAVPLKQKPHRIGYRETGLASWYGKDFHGRTTASGEIYDMFDVSAAHRSLPMGSLLLVTDVETGNRIKVRVNDRGPFVQGRILDLSYGAARLLGFVDRGITKVELEVIGRAPIFLPASRIEKAFFVQLGSYQVQENALRLKAQVARFYPDVTVKSVQTGDGSLYRVRMGPYETEEEARAVVADLRDRPDLNEKIAPIVTTNQ